MAICLGSVHLYQSVLVFMSSIWVAALDAPKRKLPLPDAAELDPNGPKVMSGVDDGGAVWPDEQATRPAESAAKMRNRRMNPCTPGPSARVSSPVVLRRAPPLAVVLCVVCA